MIGHGAKFGRKKEAIARSGLLRTAQVPRRCCCLSAAHSRSLVVPREAIRDLAPGLKAVAWADDGVIEGAEPASPNEAWIVAVQWHPEDLTERALFEGFAQAVA